MRQRALVTLGLLCLALLLVGVIFSPLRLEETPPRTDRRLPDPRPPGSEAAGIDQVATRNKLTALQPEEWKTGDSDDRRRGSFVFRTGYSF